MPAPEPPNESRAPGTDGAAADDGEGESLREQLLRFLDPGEVVVLTRERMQEAVDEAVARGRLTRQGATELVSELVARGRRQADDLVDGLAQLVVTVPAPQMRREVDRARRAAGLGPAFPIAGYDELTAAEVSARLGDLSAAELREVRDYERRNANRKSVLAAVERKLA
jgi:hypothetical protein